jgi:hypothetical protein
MYKFVTLAVAAGALLGLCSWSVAAFAQSAEEEVAKQTARQISDAISKRVGEDVGVVYAAPGAQGMATGSGEFLNSAWGTLTYNRVDFDGGTFGGSDGVNIFLGTVGYDHRFDNFIPGISVTGAHAKVDDVTGSSDGATVSPYLGYIVNDWFFLNALVGLSLSPTPTSAGRTATARVSSPRRMPMSSGTMAIGSPPGRSAIVSSTPATMKTALARRIPTPTRCWPAAR